MNREILIQEAFKKIKKLPNAKLEEVNNFADFLLSKLDNQLINENIKELTSNSSSFDFLNEEEELYDENDLKEKF
jgi:hypothetical protein